MKAEKLTEAQAIIIMGYTGLATIPFGMFHCDVEKRLGRAIYTHEFANKDFVTEVKQLYKEDFISICGGG